MPMSIISLYHYNHAIERFHVLLQYLNISNYHICVHHFFSFFLSFPFFFEKIFFFSFGLIVGLNLSVGPSNSSLSILSCFLLCNSWKDTFSFFLGAPRVIKISSAPLPHFLSIVGSQLAVVTSCLYLSTNSFDVRSFPFFLSGLISGSGFVFLFCRGGSGANSTTVGPPLTDFGSRG